MHMDGTEDQRSTTRRQLFVLQCCAPLSGTVCIMTAPVHSHCLQIQCLKLANARHTAFSCKTGAGKPNGRGVEV